jgi:hypothetical protein
MRSRIARSSSMSPSAQLRAAARTAVDLVAPTFEETAGHEAREGFAHGRPGDAKRLPQLALGRHEVAGVEPPGEDLLTQLVGDAIGESLAIELEIELVEQPRAGARR